MQDQEEVIKMRKMGLLVIGLILLLGSACAPTHVATKGALVNVYRPNLERTEGGMEGNFREDQRNDRQGRAGDPENPAGKTG